MLSGTPNAAPGSLVVPSLSPPTCSGHSSHASLISVPHVGQCQTLCVGGTPACIFPRPFHGWLLLDIQDVVYGASSTLGVNGTCSAWSPHQSLSHHIVLFSSLYILPVNIFTFIYFACLLSLAQLPLGSKMDFVYLIHSFIPRAQH